LPCIKQARRAAAVALFPSPTASYIWTLSSEKSL